MSVRHEKICGMLAELTAKFLQAETDHSALITVTNCIITPDLKQATLFIGVFPEDKEANFLEFIKKEGKDLRHFLSQKLRMRVVPRLTFQIDRGEAARTRIDQLLRNL
jgi:ribosome-binding factor A